MQHRRTTFRSDGLTLVGDLHIPDRTPAPGLVFTGPFTGVKDQVTGSYARRLAEAGYVTLAFDHRNFGESEGEPRQHEDSAGKVADLRDATSHLASFDEVDASRLGCVGICLGGAYALRFAAFDPRIGAVAFVAAAFNDPRVIREGMGPENYRGMLRRFAEVSQRQHATGEVEYMAAVAADGGEAAMGGQEPFDYYGTDRSASPHWENRVSVLSIRELITLDAMSAADFLSPTPALIVHGRNDDYCSPAGAQALYDRLGEPKELVWLDTSNHIDLYDQEGFVGPASERVAAWFDAHLRSSVNA
ncbi:MAG TPA: alpha/beta hydrolase [Actinomycetota bacterium]|jgi:uncharacterized protein|nr:alpha/beta hydrolase [Actinomycetota bacterium]